VEIPSVIEGWFIYPVTLTLPLRSGSWNEAPKYLS
jgi:hypothetical protein